MMKKMKKNLILIWEILIFLGIDQYSKYVFYTLQWGSELPFITSTFNKGISRGISIPMLIILGLSLICMVGICYLFYKKYITKWEFILFFAGSLGNLIDRVVLGGVRDFIAIGNFPIFNFADVFLTCSMILFGIREFFPNSLKRKERK